MTKFIGTFLLGFFLVACTHKETDLTTVLEIEKRLNKLEKRVQNNEEEIKVFSLIAKEFNNNYDDYSVQIIDNQTYTQKKETSSLKKYLFKFNFDKKIYKFKRATFFLKKSAIVYNQKGKKVLFLPKGTLIESSIRINKYFKIDSYKETKKIIFPNTELFLSEEAFF